MMMLTSTTMMLFLNQKAWEMSVLGASNEPWLREMEGAMVWQDGKLQVQWLPAATTTEVGVVMLSPRTRNEQEKVIVSKDGSKEAPVQVQGSRPVGDGLA
jgi:hypothetical protein